MKLSRAYARNRARARKLSITITSMNRGMS
jgi:hypothetical protein